MADEDAAGHCGEAAGDLDDLLGGVVIAGIGDDEMKRQGLLWKTTVT